jgi:hypothetical protein
MKLVYNPIIETAAFAFDEKITWSPSNSREVTFR